MSGSQKITILGINGDEYAAASAIKNIKKCDIFEAMNLLDSAPFVIADGLSIEEVTKYTLILKKGDVKYEVSNSSTPTKPTSTPKKTTSSTTSTSASKGITITITGIKGNSEEAYAYIRIVKGVDTLGAINLFSHCPFVLAEGLTKEEADSFCNSLDSAKIDYIRSDDANSISDKPKPTTTTKPTEDSNPDILSEIKRRMNSTQTGDSPKPTSTSKVTASKPVEEDPPKNAEEKLQRMIGLANVKRELNMIKAYVYKNEGKKINTHMFFVGNPGTGKTVVARLMGEILHDYGALPSAKIVECSAKELISSYIGQTAVQTGEMIQKAMGGVLYIDEAYALNPEGNTHGKECVDTLIKAMEDYRGEICFIFAGYPEDMDKLIDSNPGFDSRVKFKIHFEDYSKSELRQIVQGFFKDEKYEYSEEVLNGIINVVDAERFSKNFGNARTARTVFEKLTMIQAVRTEKNKTDRLITMEDLYEYGEQNNIKIDVGTDGQGSAIQELNQLVGLESVKTIINDLVAYFSINRGKKVDFHMSFLGNPGTGKTVVARIIGKLLNEEGLLPTSKFLEVTSSDLIAEYVGQTAPKAKEVIRKAMGGVLFIDEAYTLAATKGSEANFGAEALAELLKAMEDHRGDFCVILAGYDKEMHALFNMNPGLQSRIKFELDFPDYSNEEFAKIAQIYLKNDDYTMKDEAMKALLAVVDSKRADSNFANARTLREAISSIEIKQAGRVAKIDKTNREITIEDIYGVFGEDKVKALLENPSGQADKKVPMIPLDQLLKDAEEIKAAPFEEVQEDMTEAVVALKTVTKEGGGESSGWVFSEDGYIGTCAHCVRGATSIDVRVRVVHRHKNIDTHYPAEIVVEDDENDIAIIKIISDESFAYVRMSPEDTPDLKPLSSVYIMGYPFGVSRFDEMSVNEGKIASYQRHYKGRPDQINLDISAKSGNSGSAVIDAKTGFVIGVLCGSSTSRSGALVEEINYCRPVSYVWDLIHKGQK